LSKPSDYKRLADAENEEFERLLAMQTGTRTQAQERRLVKLLDKRCCSIDELCKRDADDEYREQNQQDFEKAMLETAESAMSFPEQNDKASCFAISLTPEKIFQEEKVKAENLPSSFTNSENIPESPELMKHEREQPALIPERQKKDSEISEIAKRENSDEQCDVDSIRLWAKHTRAEDGYDQDQESLSSPEREAIAEDLKKFDSYLIAVEALQGGGKTDLLHKLAEEEKHRLYIAWEGKESFYRKFEEKLNFPTKEEDDELYVYALTEIFDKYCGGIPVWGNPIWNKIKLPNRQLQALLHWCKTEELEIDALPTIMLLLKAFGLSEKDSREFVRRIIRSWIAELNAILFDLRDYDKLELSKYNRDIAELETLYKELTSDKKLHSTVNIVIALQKELPKTNYLFGKAEKYNLKPENPRRLIAYYKLLFHCETKPFTEEALFAVAQLSRGIWRRWKEYLNICLRQFQTEARDVITIQDVNKWITNDRIYVDWEYQLSSLFERNKPEQIYKAIQVIRYLQEHGEVEQQKLAEEIFDAEGENHNAGKIVCSRMLDTMEAHGYIRRERLSIGKSHKNIVNLADSF
jgi:hypothetical protein